MSTTSAIILCIGLLIFAISMCVLGISVDNQIKNTLKHIDETTLLLKQTIHKENAKLAAIIAAQRAEVLKHIEAMEDDVLNIMEFLMYPDEEDNENDTSEN